MTLAEAITRVHAMSTTDATLDKTAIRVVDKAALRMVLDALTDGDDYERGYAAGITSEREARVKAEAENEVEWNRAVEACARYVEVSQNRHTWTTMAKNIRKLKRTPPPASKEKKT